MTDELKPVRCGCGGEAKVYDNEVRHEFGISHFVVECQNCGIITKWKNTEAEAIEAWNKAMGERTAKAEMVDTGKGTVVFLWKCSECGQFMHRTSWSRPVKYCNSCGCRLDWNEDIPMEYFESGGK